MAQPAAPKVVLIGNSGVGKTSIFLRLQGGGFNQEQLATVGGSFSRIKVEMREGGDIDVNLWDTAGEERFRGVVPMYFSRSHAIIVVYDVTSRKSFEGVPEWVAMARERAPEDVSLIIVGNKMDMEEGRAVRVEELQGMEVRLGASSGCECSAKTGEGMDVLRGQLGMAMERKAVPLPLARPVLQETGNSTEGVVPRRQFACC